MLEEQFVKRLQIKWMGIEGVVKFFHEVVMWAKRYFFQMFFGANKKLKGVRLIWSMREFFKCVSYEFKNARNDSWKFLLVRWKIFLCVECVLDRNCLSQIYHIEGDWTWNKKISAESAGHWFLNLYWQHLPINFFLKKEKCGLWNVHVKCLLK